MKKRLLEKILVPILCTGLAVAMLTPTGITAFADDETAASESMVTSPEENDTDAAADSLTADVASTDSSVGAATDTESTDSTVEAATDAESSDESMVAPESQSSQEETTSKSEAAAGETVGASDDDTDIDSYYGFLGYKVKDDGTIKIVEHIGWETTVTIPDSIDGKPVTEIGSTYPDSKGVFANNSDLQQVKIPNSETSIGSNTFKGCTSIQQITIPNSVTEIGYHAFEDCHALKQITIPSSVTTIYGYAFMNCKSLTQVTIPDSVTSIEMYAFSGCTSLQTVSIPDSVSIIKYSGFSNCTSLQKITIPSSVTYMDSCAFTGCSSLTSIFFYGDALGVNDYIQPSFDVLNNLTLFVLKNRSGWTVPTWKAWYLPWHTAYFTAGDDTKPYVPITGLALSSENLKLNVGETSQVSVNIEPANATNPYIIWKSNHEEVAHVDANGIVTGKGEGQATLTAVAENGKVTKQVSVTVTNKTPELVRGELSASNVNENLSGTDIYLEGATIPNLKKLYYAVWSVKDGQDDLVWEEAKIEGGRWWKDVELSDMTPKSGFYDGTYNVHCYAELDDGTMEFIGSTTFKVTNHDPILSVKTKTENQAYTASMDVCPEVIQNQKQIYFAVWSAVNGQDDMHWLKATRETDRGYTNYYTFNADIRISDFNGSGLYNVHSYAQMADGSMKFLGSTTFTVKGQEQETLAMYRLYNPNSGEHFFTSSQSERDHLVSVGWKYEGTAWNASKTGTPIYRLYNPNAGDHHYTGSDAEKNNLVKLGWKYEGIAWYSAPASSGKPLYRLYNPNCTGAGAHHYTASTTERDNLVKLGWKYEGIGWYGV